MKRLTYKNFRKYDYKSFLTLALIIAFIFVSGRYLYKSINQNIKNTKSNNVPVQIAEKTNITPEPIKELHNEPAKNIEEINKQSNSSAAEKNKVKSAEKQAAKTTPAKTKTAPPAKKQVQSKPQNTFSSPEEYLSHVKNLLRSNLNTNYSIDCRVLVKPSNSIKVIEDSWNGDVAYNFIGRNFNKIPKYYDSNGHVKAIIVTFSGHSVESVDFE